MIGDIERLTLVQSHVIKLRRLAAETFDRETSLRLSAPADVPHRTVPQDGFGCPR